MTKPQKMGSEVVEQIDIAYKELCDAIQRQWDGGTALKISIPARPNHDSDLIIGSALRKAKEALTTIIANRDALAQRVKELEGAVRENWRTTPDDIDYFCAFCNAHTPYDWSTDSIEHAPDCIVRAINPQP